MKITLTSEAVEKLRGLLEEEGGDACVRLREAKVGAGWKAHIVLRLSIDERDDDDIEYETESLPFVMNPEIVDQYGENFTVTMGEDGIPVVAAA